MCKGLDSRRLTDTHTRAQKVVQDVHHCCMLGMLYNPAAMAAECRLCSTARMCRSIEVRQEVVGPCGLSSQLPRHLDFFAEK